MSSSRGWVAWKFNIGDNVKDVHTLNVMTIEKRWWAFYRGKTTKFYACAWGSNRSDFLERDLRKA
jgi:hypothetical protein